MSLPEEDLPETKIKRTYKCRICDHKTTNPRNHLTHRRDVHNETKVKLVKCKFCLYACQYRQKLNRHLRLVHRRNPDGSIMMVNHERNESMSQQAALSSAPMVNGLNSNTDLDSNNDFFMLLNNSINNNNTNCQPMQQYNVYNSLLNYLQACVQDSMLASDTPNTQCSQNEPLDLSFPEQIKQLIKSRESISSQ